MEDRKRSRPYPSEPLSRCVEWARDIRRQLGTGGCDATMLAEAMGSRSLSGTAKTRIAALGYFGLLDRSSGRYTLSDLAIRLLNPTSEHEEGEAIRQAFLKPALYADLVDRYETEGRLPERLPNILLREFNILEGANESVARDFVESGRFARVLDEEGCFVSEKPLPAADEDPAEVRSAGPAITGATAAPAGTLILDVQLIGDRTARLVYPRDLSPDECKLIELQVNALKQQVDIRSRSARACEEH